MHQATGRFTAVFTAALLVGMAGLAAAQRQGHTCQIETLRFSPDGGALLSGGHDGRVIYWDAASGDVLLTPTTLPLRPRVVAIRTANAPTLDGQLDDAVWRAANAADGFKPTDTWNPDKPVEAPTEAKFAWDEDNLYIAIRAFEPKLDQIVSTLTGPAQALHGDDHVQLFIDPGREYATNRYFGYSFPASGMHLGVYGKMGDIGSTRMTIREGRETGEQSAWTLEVAIPWSSLLSDNWRKLTVKKPTSGLNMAMNLRRYRMPGPGETSMWSPSEPSLTGMPWRWGSLVLE